MGLLHVVALRAPKLTPLLLTALHLSSLYLTTITCLGHRTPVVTDTPVFMALNRLRGLLILSPDPRTTLTFVFLGPIIVNVLWLNITGRQTVRSRLSLPTTGDMAALMKCMLRIPLTLLPQTGLGSVHPRVLA